MFRIVVLVVVLSVAGPAAVASNAQRGDNTASSAQGGEARSGDAVGGPGLALIREGDVRLEMTNAPDAVAQRVTGSPGALEVTNVSRPSRVSTGTAAGTNDAAGFVGLSTSGDADVVASVFGFALG